jgi:hypothetical protein
MINADVVGSGAFALLLAGGGEVVAGGAAAVVPLPLTVAEASPCGAFFFLAI